MDWIFKYFSSSIGKKQVVGLTGLLLVGFLFVHLAGNFLFLLGPDKFNEYSHMLTSSPLIYPAEIVLVLIFLVHIGFAINVTIMNKQANQGKYAMSEPHTSLSAKLMPLSGLVLAFFLVGHVVSMKFGAYYPTTVNTQEVRDIYKLVVETFQNKAALLGYIFVMVVLGLHLNHGVASVFQTLGLNHPRYNTLICYLSKLVAWGLSIGFILVALFASFVTL